MNNQIDRLNFFGFRPFVISSSSMEPSFLKGSFLITNEIAKDQIQVGDMLAYRATDNMLIFHRVVGINDDGFTMKGDRLDSADGKRVTYDKIVGKAFFHTNLLVNISNIANAYRGLILATFITVTSIIFVVFGVKYIMKLRYA